MRQPDPFEARQRLTRRAFLKRLLGWGTAALAVPAGGYSYARWAEPRWLEIRRQTLTLARLPAAMSGGRMAHFSDVHLGFHYTAAQLRQLAGLINEQRPDVICFTGDLVDYSVGDVGPEAAMALQSMQAPYGKYAVLGNHDYYGRAAGVVELLQAGGFRVLRNDAAPLTAGAGRVWLAGVEDQWNGKPDLPQALRQVPQDECTILLSHCPDFADIAVRHAVDLQLSGHSHGGQVRLPFYGHLVTPRYSKKYVQGLYSLDGGKLQVYVNRGIGVSVYPIRFWCRPELTVLTLQRGGG